MTRAIVLALALGVVAAGPIRAHKCGGCDHSHRGLLVTVCNDPGEDCVAPCGGEGTCEEKSGFMWHACKCIQKSSVGTSFATASARCAVIITPAEIAPGVTCMVTFGPASMNDGLEVFLGDGRSAGGLTQGFSGHAVVAFHTAGPEGIHGDLLEFVLDFPSYDRCGVATGPNHWELEPASPRGMTFNPETGFIDFDEALDLVVVEGGDPEQPGWAYLSFGPVEPGMEETGAWITESQHVVLRDYAEHDAGACLLTVTDQGIVGFMDMTQTEGSGFRYPEGGANHLFVGSFWLGNEPAFVANRDYDADPAREWQVSWMPEGHVCEPPFDSSDQDIEAIFDDSGGAAPRGLRVSQESWAFSDPEEDDFVILRYRIENAGELPLLGLYAGEFLDFDLGDGTDDLGQVDLGFRLVDIFDPAGIHAGLVLLETPWDLLPPVNLTLVHNPTFVWPNGYIPDPDKFAFLAASDPGHVMHEGLTADDYSALVSAGPLDLFPGESREVAVALVGGLSEEEVRAHAVAAQEAYFRVVVGVSEETSGSNMALSVLARPNPFRDGTTLRFRLDTAQPLRLSVFDASGRHVWSERREAAAPGWQGIAWDGRDTSGRPVAAGVYFVRLSTPGTVRRGVVVRIR